MSRFSTPSSFDNGPPPGAIPKHPEHCQRCNSADAKIALVIVNDRAGRLKSGPFSDFGKVTGKDNDVWIMRDGNEFLRWWTRCALCYLRHLDREMARDWEPDNQAVDRGQVRRDVRKITEGATA